MEKFTPELIEKAKAAKSVEELLAIAEENEVVLAKEIKDELNLASIHIEESSASFKFFE